MTQISQMHRPVAAVGRQLNPEGVSLGTEPGAPMDLQAPTGLAAKMRLRGEASVTVSESA